MSRSIGKGRPTAHLGVFVGAAFLTAALSQADRQVFRADQTFAKAEKAGRGIDKRADLPRRGSIVSRDGQVLAQSRDEYRLSLSKEAVPRSPGFFADLGQASGIPAAEIQAAVESSVKRPSWSQSLGTEEVNRVRQVQKRWGADGVSLDPVSRRMYPLGPAVASILGNIVDGKPSGGLEQALDEDLAGRKGMRRGVTDRYGAYLPGRMESDSYSREDGKEIVLTLDADLQASATVHLQRSVEAHKADRGVALVMDPKTGDLLAMASWPEVTPDPTKSISGYNPNYSMVFEPGSTFKILTMAEAMETGDITRNTVIQCDGTFHFGRGYRVRCDAHGGGRAHGPLDPEMAIAKSCNVSAAKWALMVGRDKMIENLDKLGLLKPTGIGVPKGTDVAGQFNFGEWAKQQQVANVGFGQSISCTPVALISAYSTLANGGVRMKPRLIKRIGELERKPEVAARVFSEPVAEEVMELMEAVIGSDRGTGKSLRIDGYRLAGKTGTAQKIGSGQGYVSSFVGYVPANDPQAVILVMVDNPKGSQYYGSQVAGPVFRAVALDLIRTMRISPERKAHARR